MPITENLPQKEQINEPVHSYVSPFDLPDGIYDGECHCGVAIMLTVEGKTSSIMIPDAGKISEGSPVFTTGRVSIHGYAIMNLLTSKGVKLPEALSRLIANSSISCDAFYYSTNKVTFKEDDAKGKAIRKTLSLKDEEWKTWLDDHKVVGGDYSIDEGPLLMVFSITFGDGLITELTGEEQIGKLFDIKGGSVRVVRCPHEKEGVLKDYVKMLRQAN